jgi:hypothetical protein
MPMVCLYVWNNSSRELGYFFRQFRQVANVETLPLFVCRLPVLCFSSTRLGSRKKELWCACFFSNVNEIDVGPHNSEFQYW